MSEWHRADHGDMPEAGTEVSAVMYPADSVGSVIVYSRLRVEAVLESVHGINIHGPSLPSALVFSLPGRPNDIIGRRGIFWKPYEEPSDDDGA